MLVEKAARVVARKSSCTPSASLRPKLRQQQWTANRQTGTSSLEAPRILTFSVAALLCVEMRGGWVFGFF
ncbi:hypothetical protein [Microcoleus sp.]|uniref:hypothetical protein n=1 Tax=Microcoleus sp. TaxID=44472 RepID=UPI0035260754